MKQIALKTLAMADGKLLDYRIILIEICRHHPEGIRVADMNKAIRVKNRLIESNGTAKLEDADWEVLCVYVENYPFASADESIIQMHDDVKNAESVEVK